MSAFLELKGLTKSFDAGQARYEVFSDVSLTLEKGEFLCIVGSSGCGKTTLLRVVGGFERATGGEVLLEGRPVTAPGPRCAMVFQTFDQLLPWKTVEDNIAYPLTAGGQARGRREARARSGEYLEMVGLTQFARYYPHQLSGGMKQRVAIARALAMRPELILMDEPFASLDAESRTTLQKELKRIWRESGITVLFVTHSIIESISLSTKLMAMGQAPSVKLFMDNPVEGPREALKTPESPGYAECWGMLSKAIRK
jgi:NitT/TauT family transport system ATP-binding protein